MHRYFSHIILLLGFLLSIIPFYAQKNPASTEKKWNNLQEKIEKSSLKEVKNSFEEFSTWATHHQEDSLLLKSILHLGNYYKEQGEYGERIRWYQFAIDSLCGVNGNIQCVKIRREFAAIYEFIEQYDKANELLKKNITYLSAQNFSDALSLEYSLLAKNYLRNKNYERAEQAYLHALTAAEESKSVFYLILAYNNLGFFYAQMSNTDKAVENYLKGINILEEKDSLTQQHEAQLALLKGNLGGIYINNEYHIDQGIQFLKADFAYNFDFGDFDLATHAVIELVKYYFEHKDFEKANKILQLNVEKSKSQKENDEVTQLMVPVYYWLFKVHLEQQQNQKALYYFKSYDSLKTIRDERRETRRSNIEKSLLENILHVQLEYQEQQIELKSKENQLLIDKNRDFYYRLLIGMFSFVVLVIVIFLYSKKRISLMRVKKELAERKFEVEKLEKQKTKIELNYKNKDLTDFAIDISRKQEILTEIKTKLKEVLKIKDDENERKKAIKTLIQYANNNLLVDEQLKEFQENIEEVNYKFLDQLQEKYPDLTTLDKNICGLIRLGLSNKEIAIMRNVSYKAIRMSRYRIRKKLGLTEDVDLVEFLKSIE